MSESTIVQSTIVRANIGNGVQILFADKEAALLFVANAGTFDQFKQVYKNLMDKKATVKVWREYTSPESHIRCLDVLEQTKLTNGLTLMEAVKQRVVAASSSLLHAI